MNIKKYNGMLAALAVAWMFLSFTFFSCKKTGETSAEITVLDTAGKPVAGASVTLWEDTSISHQTGQKAIVRVTKPSDAGGKATFTFTQPAILNIWAVKNNDTAKGLVRLKEYETVTQTVKF